MKEETNRERQIAAAREALGSRVLAGGEAALALIVDAVRAVSE